MWLASVMCLSTLGGLNFTSLVSILSAINLGTEGSRLSFTTKYKSGFQ